MLFSVVERERRITTTTTTNSAAAYVSLIYVFCGFIFFCKRERRWKWRCRPSEDTTETTTTKITFFFKLYCRNGFFIVASHLDFVYKMCKCVAFYFVAEVILLKYTTMYEYIPVIWRLMTWKFASRYSRINPPKNF